MRIIIMNLAFIKHWHPVCNSLSIKFIGKMIEYQLSLTRFRFYYKGNY